MIYSMQLKAIGALIMLKMSQFRKVLHKLKFYKYLEVLGLVLFCKHAS